MTKLQTILLAVLSAVIAGLLYKFVPDLKELAATFAMLAAALAGWARQHPADKAVPIEADSEPTKPLPKPSPNTPVIGTGSR